MLLSIAFLWLTVNQAFSVQAPSPSEHQLYLHPQLEYSFCLPDSWQLKSVSDDDVHLVQARDDSTGSSIVVVVIDPYPDGNVEALARSRDAQHAQALQTEAVISDAKIDGWDAKRIELHSDAANIILVEHVFITEGKGYILQGHFPRSQSGDDIEAFYTSFTLDVEDLLPDVDAIRIDQFEDSKTKGPVPDPIPLPAKPSLDIRDGDQGTMILIRESDSKLEDIKSFALALPFSRVGDAPVCLLVGDTLTTAQVDLLNRLPVKKRVMIGEAPKELERFVTDRVPDAVSLRSSSKIAVVASPHIGDLLEAAPYAFAHGLPLLVSSRSIVEELKSLEVEEVVLFGSHQKVFVPPTAFPQQDLSDPSTRWAITVEQNPEAPYLAIANYGASRGFGSGAPLGACALAARHRGMLRVLWEDVEFHYADLRECEQAPPGRPEDEDYSWGEFDLPGGKLSVAVPRVGMLVGMGAVEKVSDPYIDLDGDGSFSDHERVSIGDVRRFADQEYSFSLRCVGAIMTSKFRDGLRKNRAVALSTPAEEFADQIHAIFPAQVPPRYLLIAGDHREIPHDYVRDRVYAETTMHEQELATDNLYSDIDRDGDLDISVGRLVTSSPSTATCTAARMACYQQLQGDWRKRACLIYPVWPEDEMAMNYPIVFASFEAFMHDAQVTLEEAGFEIRDHLRERGDLQVCYPSLSGNSLVLFAHHAGPDSWMFRFRGNEPGDVQLLFPARGKESEKIPPGCGVIPPLDGAPIVMSLGCDSCGLDYEVRYRSSLVHSFFEEGAVAYLGNTRAGFPDTEEHLFIHVLNQWLGMNPTSSEPVSLGEAFRRGKNYLGFLIRNRGPFTSTPPFSDYQPAMEREWNSLILYGDPAMALNSVAPSRKDSITLETQVIDKALRVELTWKGEVARTPIWIMERVGLGPLRELRHLTAPGLEYGSVPWATYPEASQPGPVTPGLFFELELPQEISIDAQAKILEGPAWALGGSEVVTRGDQRVVQLSVDLIRYAMGATEEAQLARKVVLLIE